MKINTIIRIITNKIRFAFLKLKYKDRVNIEGGQFFDTSTTLLIGKGAIRFEKSLMAEKNCYFSVCAGGYLEIGEKTFFNRFCYIASRNKISIGANCNFGPNVSIYDHDHLFDENGVKKNEYKTAPIVIGDNCWIGDGAKILRGTTIGDGCVIGAGTILKGHIPAHSVVVEEKKLFIRKIDN